MSINSILMWVILQNNADWGCFQTPILQEILKLKIHFTRNIMRVWKSYICSKKLDVWKTNFSFAQFNKIRNHFFGRKIEDAL